MYGTVLFVPIDAVAYPGFFFWLPGNPPGHDFSPILKLLAPTFTSPLNLSLLETPLETNSGYATEIHLILHALCRETREMLILVEHNSLVDAVL